MFSRTLKYISLNKNCTIIVFVSAFTILSLVANRYQSDHSRSDFLFNSLSLTYMLFYLSIHIAIVVSVLKYKVGIEKWGFTLTKRSLISIGLGLIILYSFYSQTKSRFLLVNTFPIFWQTIGASGEEFIFRVLLITALANIFSKFTVYKGPFAILTSSILFTIPHWFTSSYISQGYLKMNQWVINIFFLAVTSGIIFYISRSNFFSILLHVTVNTQENAGILIGLVFACIYFVLVIGKKISIKTKANKGLPLDTS